MVLITALQNSYSREQRLQFVREHQEAFDVEPEFPLPLLENSLLEIEDYCVIELSCKVEGDQLFAGRIVGIDNAGSVWTKSIPQALRFLDAVESRAGIEIDRNFLELFLAAHANSNKIVANTIGIDLRPKLEDSSVKIHILLDQEQDFHELVMTAIALDGSRYSDELTQVLLKNTFEIGFDFFLNGHSEIELYTICPGGQDKSFMKGGFYLKSYAQKNFSHKVVSLIEQSAIFMAGFSRANTDPVLYFAFNSLEEIKKHFLFNSLGDRVYSFCQGKNLNWLPCIGVTEQELMNNRLGNFRFYYKRAFFENI